MIYRAPGVVFEGLGYNNRGLNTSNTWSDTGESTRGMMCTGVQYTVKPESLSTHLMKFLFFFFGTFALYL